MFDCNISLICNKDHKYIPTMSTENNFDVVIVGAGISGIDAAYRLQEQTPDRTYTIIEARDAIGGTWDLFRFPGIRSDSGMLSMPLMVPRDET